MRMPRFTADVALGQAEEHYAGRVAASGSYSSYISQLVPAFVAPPPVDGPPFCSTSACLSVGGCRTSVRCCRIPGGRCVCTATPCFVPFPI